MMQSAPDSSLHGTPAYRQISVALIMAGFSTFALMYDVQRLLPLFAAQFGVNPATSSLAASLTTGTMALAFIPAAVLSDRTTVRHDLPLMASAELTLLSAVVPVGPSCLRCVRRSASRWRDCPASRWLTFLREVHPNSIGSAMGLYIAASAIGGMAGRLGMAFISQYTGWLEAIGLMGAAGLAAGPAFAVFAPQSRALSPTHHDLRSLMIAMCGLLADSVLPLLYVEGFLLMGGLRNHLQLHQLSAGSPPVQPE